MRRGGRAVLGLAWALPALVGLVVALRPASAAWLVERDLADPFLSLVCPRAAPAGDAEIEEALRVAAERDPLSYRYPLKLGKHLWLERGRKRAQEHLLRADALFARAATLAPTDAQSRFYLSDTSYALGRVREADRQALAALELAPLHPDLRPKICRRFWRRFRTTRSPEHLEAAIRASDLDDVDTLSLNFNESMLTFDELQRAFEIAEFGVERRLDLLLRARRFDWALDLARGGGEEGSGSDSREGRIRVEYGSYLLDRGAFESAREQLEVASELGTDVDPGTLGRARLLAGATAEGLASLGEFLAGGGGTAEVREILAEAGIGPDARLAFWKGRAERDGGSAGARLEEARALLDGGDPGGAAELLGDLVEDRAAAGEAHFLLARVCLARGNARLAESHARKALERTPGEPRYVELLEQLAGKVK